jgi:hypothetical protein
VNYVADIARELGLDHMEVYNILHPYVKCQCCGNTWDTISPCAPCMASRYAVMHF